MTKEIAQLFILENTYEEMLKAKLPSETFLIRSKNRTLYPIGWDNYNDTEKKKEILLTAINNKENIRDFFCVPEEAEFHNRFK